MVLIIDGKRLYKHSSNFETNGLQGVRNGTREYAPPYLSISRHSVIQNSMVIDSTSTAVISKPMCCRVYVTVLKSMPRHLSISRHSVIENYHRIVYMVTHFARVWINGVRLPILLVVS